MNSRFLIILLVPFVLSAQTRTTINGVANQTTNGSGVLYNPSNTLYVFTGDSILADDTHVLGAAITVTGGSCNGTVCTFTNSGTNGLSVGDWVYVAAPITPPSPFGADSTTYSMFPVIASGLSSTQFEFNYTVGTATISAGTAIHANYFLPFSAMAQPFFSGHGTVNVTTDDSYEISGYDADYSPLFHSISPAATGNNPEYLILNDIFNNDLQVCASAATIEGHLQSFWAQAHTDGWIVVQGTSTSSPFNSTVFGCESAFQTQKIVNTWLLSQGKSYYTTTGAGTGEYWDRLADMGSILSNPSNTSMIASNGGLAPGGVQPYTQALNAAMSSQASDIRYQDDYCYIGTPNTVSTDNRGLICTPTADNVTAFTWTNAAGTPIAWINTGAATMTVTGEIAAGQVFGIGGTGSFNQAPITSENTLLGSSPVATLFAPNLPTGDFAVVAIGQSQNNSNYNDVDIFFNYTGGAGSTLNNGSINIGGASGLDFYGDGGVSVPSVANSPNTSYMCPGGTAGRFTISGCGPVSAAVTSATGGSGTGTITCATASCTNLRGSYTVAGGTFATGTLLTLVWPTTTTAYTCIGSVLNNATGASIGYHGIANATGVTFSSLTAATGLTVDIDYSCQP